MNFDFLLSSDKDKDEDININKDINNDDNPLFVSQNDDIVFIAISKNENKNDINKEEDNNIIKIIKKNDRNVENNIRHIRCNNTNNTNNITTDTDTIKKPNLNKTKIEELNNSLINEIQHRILFSTNQPTTTHTTTLDSNINNSNKDKDIITSFININKYTLIRPFEGEVFIPYINNNFYAGSSDEELIKYNPGIRTQVLFLKRRQEALERIYGIGGDSFCDNGIGGVRRRKISRKIFIDDIYLDINVHPDLVFYMLTGDYKVNKLYLLVKKYNILNYHSIPVIPFDCNDEVNYSNFDFSDSSISFENYIKFKKWFYESFVSSHDLNIRRSFRILNNLLYYSNHMSEEELDSYYNIKGISKIPKFIFDNLDKEVKVFGDITSRVYTGKQYKEKLILNISNIKEIKSKLISDIRTSSIVIDFLSIVVPDKYRKDKLDLEFSPGNEIAIIGYLIYNTDKDNKAKYTLKVKKLETFVSYNNQRKNIEYENYRRRKLY